MTDLVTLPAEPLFAAARALALACRFGEARALLSDLEHPSTPTFRARLLLARADVEHRAGYVTNRREEHSVSALLEEATHVLAGQDEPSLAWDVERLRVQHRYAAALRRADGTPWFGPEGRDAAFMTGLCVDAEALRDTAPDAHRRGWAEMLCGWISDNVVGDRDRAPAHYHAALESGRTAGDHLMVFEAQRHLGDHAHDEGHHGDTSARWEESAEAAARAGNVGGVLAQQLLLAVLARDAGDGEGARLLATEVRRWAGAVDAADLAAQADGFLAGADPTKPDAEVAV